MKKIFSHVYFLINSRSTWWHLLMSTLRWYWGQFFFSMTLLAVKYVFFHRQKINKVYSLAQIYLKIISGYGISITFLKIYFKLMCSRFKGLIKREKIQNPPHMTFCNKKSCHIFYNFFVSQPIFFNDPSKFVCFKISRLYFIY